MAKKTKLIEVTIQRRPDGTIGGPLTLNFEATNAEKKEALVSMLRMVLTVAHNWNLRDLMREAAEAMIANETETAVPAAPGRGRRGTET